MCGSHFVSLGGTVNSQVLCDQRFGQPGVLAIFFVPCKFYLVENSERQENGIRDEAKWDGAVVARI